MPNGQAVGLRRRKYAVLLALLVVALAIATFHAQSGAARLRTDAVRTVLGTAIWIVVFERPRERAMMAVVLLVSLAINWGQHFTAASLDHALSLADQVVLSLFLCYAVYVILRDLFRAPAVGAENVLGAICGYLIAGNAWAHINAIAYLLVPSAYSINPELAGLLPDWHGRTALFTYYAFAQVTTIGYSDVTPIHAPATTLSLFAALFGVFYTAVVVSQFVGLAQKPTWRQPVSASEAANNLPSALKEIRLSGLRNTASLTPALANARRGATPRSDSTSGSAATGPIRTSPGAVVKIASRERSAAAGRRREAPAPDVVRLILTRIPPHAPQSMAFVPVFECQRRNRIVDASAVSPG